MKHEGQAASWRAVNLTIDSALLTRARAEGLNVSALAEEAVAAALERIAREKFADDIAQGCHAHECYLEAYGSLVDALDAAADAAG